MIREIINRIEIKKKFAIENLQVLTNDHKLYLSLKSFFEPYFNVIEIKNIDLSQSQKSFHAFVIDKFVYEAILKSQNNKKKVERFYIGRGEENLSAYLDTYEFYSENIKVYYFNNYSVLYLVDKNDSYILSRTSHNLLRFTRRIIRCEYLYKELV